MLLVTLLRRQMHFISIHFTTQRSLLAFRYNTSYFVSRIIFRGYISEVFSPKRCNLPGEAKTRDARILLTKYWSVKHHLLIREGVKSRVESRIREDTVNLSFSDYESFPLYLDSHWER